MMHMAPTRQTSGFITALASAITLAGVTPAHAQDFDIDEVVRAVRTIAREVRIDRRTVNIGTFAIEKDVVFDRLEAGIGQRRDLRAERTDRSTQTLAIGPNGSLELRNVSGDITVRAGSGRDAVVEIIRHSRGRTENDAARGLSDVQPLIDHRGERATIEMDYRRGDMPYQVSADFEVVAPAGTRITARSVSGDVSITGIKGDVAVDVVSGNLRIASSGRVSKASSISGDVSLTDIQGSDTLTASSVSGSVAMTNVQARRVSVEVTSGDVRAQDIRCDSASLKSLSGSVSFSGRLSPNGRYELNSHSGSVHLTAEGPVGFELQATSFSGRIQADELSLTSVSRNRSALRATVGDGSAVVAVQTFSGDVTISRGGAAGGNRR